MQEAVGAEHRHADESPAHWGWFLSSLLAGSFVLGAVVLEWLSGDRANSPEPGWAELVPLAWPQPLRVVWWLLVTAAAGWFRYGMHRYGMRQRPLVVAATVVPFAAFALGVATGAEWATWH